MKPNPLNAVFTAPQVKAIERYTAEFLANVLKTYEVGSIEAKPEPKAKKAVAVEGVKE